MADETPKQKPELSREGRRQAEERAARRAEMLRRNLLKRKAQRRDRAARDVPPEETEC